MSDASDESSKPIGNEKPWIKRGAKAVLGMPLTMTVAVWGYSTFIQKDEANARFKEIRQDVRISRDESKQIRSDVATQIYNQFQLLQSQLEGVRTEQRETNKRIDRMLMRMPESISLAPKED